MLYFASQIMDYKGVYDASTSYKKGNIVSDQKSSYICIQDNSGISTSNTMYWAFLSSDISIIDDTNVSSTTTTFSASNIISRLDAISNEGGNISLEEWVVGGGERVEIFDESPPMNVSGVNITFLDKTSLVLNWTESTSTDSKEYVIYNGSTLLSVVPATSSKLMPLTYQVASLVPATNYTFKITTRDVANNESNGVVTTVRTYGNYALSMNGSTDFIKLPSLTFNKIELTCIANPGNIGVWYYFLDARAGVATGYFAINGNGNVQYSDIWSNVLINGSPPVNINDIKNKKITLALSLATSGTDDINIYSDYLNKPAMIGNLYTIKVFNNGNVVAFYNLTEQFVGSALVDASGNGKTAVRTGGTWVTG